MRLRQSPLEDDADGVTSEAARTTPRRRRPSNRSRRTRTVVSGTSRGRSSVLKALSLWLGCALAFAKSFAEAFAGPGKYDARPGALPREDHAVIAITVDGHVHTLDAWSGNVRGVFVDSGGPLVSSSTSFDPPDGAGEGSGTTRDGEEDGPARHRRNPLGGGFVVPGLDGVIYLLGPDGRLSVLMSSAPDVVLEPRMACLTVSPDANGVIEDESCGLLIGEKSTQLFSLDTETGQARRVDGGGGRDHAWDHASEPHHHQQQQRQPQSRSNLLLQRDEYVVRAHDAATSEELWFVTLAHFSALDLEGKGGPTALTRAKVAAADRAGYARVIRQRSGSESEEETDDESDPVKALPHPNRDAGLSDGLGEFRVEDFDYAGAGSEWTAVEDMGGVSGEEIAEGRLVGDRRQHARRRRRFGDEYASRFPYLLYEDNAFVVAMDPIDGSVLWRREMPSLAVSLYGIRGREWVDILPPPMSMLHPPHLLHAPSSPPPAYAPNAPLFKPHTSSYAHLLAGEEVQWSPSHDEPLLLLTDGTTDGTANEDIAWLKGSWLSGDDWNVSPGAAAGDGAVCRQSDSDNSREDDDTCTALATDGFSDPSTSIVPAAAAAAAATHGGQSREGRVTGLLQPGLRQGQLHAQVGVVNGQFFVSSSLRRGPLHAAAEDPAAPSMDRYPHPLGMASRRSLVDVAGRDVRGATAGAAGVGATGAGAADAGAGAASTGLGPVQLPPPVPKLRPSAARPLDGSGGRKPGAREGDSGGVQPGSATIDTTGGRRARAGGGGRGGGGGIHGGGIRSSASATIGMGDWRQALLDGLEREIKQGPAPTGTKLHPDNRGVYMSWNLVATLAGLLSAVVIAVAFLAYKYGAGAMLNMSSIARKGGGALTGLTSPAAGSDGANDEPTSGTLSRMQSAPMQDSSGRVSPPLPQADPSLHHNASDSSAMVRLGVTPSAANGPGSPTDAILLRARSASAINIQRVHSLPALGHTHSPPIANSRRPLASGWHALFSSEETANGLKGVGQLARAFTSSEIKSNGSEPSASAGYLIGGEPSDSPPAMMSARHQLDGANPAMSALRPVQEGAWSNSNVVRNETTSPTHSPTEADGDEESTARTNKRLSRFSDASCQRDNEEESSSSNSRSRSRSRSNSDRERFSAGGRQRRSDSPGGRRLGSKAIAESKWHRRTRSQRRQDLAGNGNEDVSFSDLRKKRASGGGRESESGASSRTSSGSTSGSPRERGAGGAVRNDSHDRVRNGRMASRSPRASVDGSSRGQSRSPRASEEGDGRMHRRPSRSPRVSREQVEEIVLAGSSASDPLGPDGNPPEALLVTNRRLRTEFVEGQKLGRGGFGAVYKCRNRLDGHDYAIKKIRLSSDPRWQSQLAKVLREVKIMSLLDHPNIVRYYQAWLEKFTEEDEELLRGEAAPSVLSESWDHTTGGASRATSGTAAASRKTQQRSFAYNDGGVSAGGTLVGKAAAAAAAAKISRHCDASARPPPHHWPQWSPTPHGFRSRGSGGGGGGVGQKPLSEEHSVDCWSVDSRNMDDRGHLGGGGSGRHHGVGRGSGSGGRRDRSGWLEPGLWGGMDFSLEGDEEDEDEDDVGDLDDASLPGFVFDRADAEGSPVTDVRQESPRGESCAGGGDGVCSGGGCKSSWMQVNERRPSGSVSASATAPPSSYGCSDGRVDDKTICGRRSGCNGSDCGGVANALPTSCFGGGGGGSSVGEDTETDSDRERESRSNDDDSISWNRARPLPSPRTVAATKGHHRVGSAPSLAVAEGRADAAAPARSKSDETNPAGVALTANALTKANRMHRPRGESWPLNPVAAAAEANDAAPRGCAGSTLNARGRRTRMSDAAAVPTPSRKRTFRKGAWNRGWGGGRRRGRSKEVYDLWLYIQMQYCSHNNLQYFLEEHPDRRSQSRVDMPQVMHIFLQVAKGLQYVHACGLIHRDLKPANCFLMAEGTVKIGDFGLSRHILPADGINGRTAAAAVAAASAAADAAADAADAADDRHPASFTWESDQHLVGDDASITGGVGTYLYASPEQMSGQGYDEKTDVYSLGMLLFEMCHPPFGTKMERTVVLTNAHRLIFPAGDVWGPPKGQDAMKSLCRAMLQEDSTSRPSAADIVRQVELMQGKHMLLQLDKKPPSSYGGGGGGSPGVAVVLQVEALEHEGLLHRVVDRIRALCKGQEGHDSRGPGLGDLGGAGGARLEQYGLRGHTGSAIMEFLVAGAALDERMAIIEALESMPEVKTVREFPANG